MISYAEAQELVDKHFKLKLKSSKVSILKSVGYTLSDNVFADRNIPPYNRVTMDGIAINYTGSKNLKWLKPEGIQLAGEAQKTLKNPKNCLEVMTGSILPNGCDSVIPYEQVSENKSEGLFALNDDFKPFKNIHKEGSDCKQGVIVVERGKIIRPTEIGVFASMGYSSVPVYEKIKTAIISTGDEIVPVEQEPKTHQIRSSNKEMLFCQLLQLGIEANTFHLNDSKTELKKALKEILQEHELIIMSGAVSKGKADFVPEILEELGVEKVFHKVKQRPGKPMWFGKRSDCLVFGLPGNPASALSCYLNYIKPRLSPQNDLKLKLAEDFFFDKDLQLFYPVKIYEKDDEHWAIPLSNNGSGDFLSLAEADGFLEFPANQNQYKSGEAFRFIPF